MDEAAVAEFVKDIQKALIVADVDVKLVLDLSNRIRERVLKKPPPPGVSLRDHVIYVVYEELTNLLGKDRYRISISPGRGHVLLLVGIQGSGKTVSAVKLARWFSKRGLRAGVVCADTYRPGAYQQLVQYAKPYHIEVYGDPTASDALRVAKEGVEFFRKRKYDIIVVDTAGRHKKEDALMQEMRLLYKKLNPDCVGLVISADMGQQAGPLAAAFHQIAPVGFIILTKMDGTAKGGGALSAIAATGARVAFLGTGEKVDDFEEFVPSRFVARLLGLGDLEGLLERVKQAQLQVTSREARRMLRGKITLEELVSRLEQVRRMGPLTKLLSYLPGGMMLPDEVFKELDKLDEKLKRWRAILNSMTREEKENPRILNASRIRRIARGAGVSERDVRELVQSYRAFQKMMKSGVWRRLMRTRMRTPSI